MARGRRNPRARGLLSSYLCRSGGARGLRQSFQGESRISIACFLPRVSAIRGADEPIVWDSACSAQYRAFRLETTAKPNPSHFAIFNRWSHPIHALRKRCLARKTRSRRLVTGEPASKHTVTLAMNGSSSMAVLRLITMRDVFQHRIESDELESLAPLSEPERVFRNVYIELIRR